MKTLPKTNWTVMQPAQATSRHRLAVIPPGLAAAKTATRKKSCPALTAAPSDPANKNGPWVNALLALLVLGASTQAAPPEVSNVFPDFPTEYPNASPHLITGEGFELGKTEVWIWSPGKEVAAVTDVLAGLGAAEPTLPEQPPKDARRVSTLDVEPQVIA